MSHTSLFKESQAISRIISDWNLSLLVLKNADGRYSIKHFGDQSRRSEYTLALCPFSCLVYHILFRFKLFTMAMQQDLYRQMIVPKVEEMYSYNNQSEWTGVYPNEVS